MRQIVLDTETTGLSPDMGHRLIEIGCIVLEDRKIIQKTFHTYLNPQREVEEGAFRVHGISTEFLQDKPFFADVVDQFIEFIKDSELIIHNAAFDVGFLNAELARLKWKKKISDYCVVTDSLQLAREKHPRQRNTLDALCKRYEIDNSHRTFHGALLDAQILALVYLAMTGGQTELFVEELMLEQNLVIESVRNTPPLICNSPVILPNEEELARHLEFIDFINKNSLTNRWLETTE